MIAARRDLGERISDAYFQFAVTLVMLGRLHYTLCSPGTPPSFVGIFESRSVTNPDSVKIQEFSQKSVFLRAKCAAGAKKIGIWIPIAGKTLTFCQNLSRSAGVSTTLRNFSSLRTAAYRSGFLLFRRYDFLFRFWLQNRFSEYFSSFLARRRRNFSTF